MSTPSRPAIRPSAASFRWSLRILILALAGISLLTLYPFHLQLHAHPGYASPFFLQGWEKSGGPLDIFLNILLFAPFGFGLAGLLRKKGFSRVATAALCLVTGVLVSYGVEFTQFFIPQRDSGWEDVVTNSTGSLVGAVIFLAIGLPLLRILQAGERSIEKFATLKTGAVILVLYFTAWFAASAHFQKETTLSGWHPGSFLTVGGFSHNWSMHPWQGRMSVLEFWDYALPGDLASSLTSSSSTSSSSGSIASYEFAAESGAVTSFQDLRHELPDLNIQYIRYGDPPPSPGFFDGNFWLATPTPVPNLTDAIRKTGRFSIHMQFVPAQVGGDVDASLITISRPGETPDLEIRQADEALAVWLHTPATSPQPRLDWSVPRVFAAGRPRNIIISFDGAKLWAYLDGTLFYDGFRVGPATPLAVMVRRHPQVHELQGYRYVYYGILFFPAGCALGFLARNLLAKPRNVLLLVILGALMPTVALEIILVHVGFQPFSAGAIALAIFMSVAGWFWIDVEGRVPAKTV